jgi:hypothetical protein
MIVTTSKGETMKAKEWLLKNGHIKEITRGRISRDNHALIEDAVRKGAQIEGFSVSTAPTKDEKPAAVTKVPMVSAEKVIYDIGPERYVESEWVAYIHEDGKQKEIGLRTVCNTCGASLTYHVCESPRVWVEFDREAVVHFKPRTAPLPAKRFF